MGSFRQKRARTCQFGHFLPIFQKLGKTWKTRWTPWNQGVIIPTLWKSLDMASRPDNLPDYKQPPIREVVVGVQFSRLPITGAHVGLFWSTLRDELSEAVEQPFLEPNLESFGPLRAAPLKFEINFAVAPSRHWLASADKSELIQLQVDRFIYNWRKTDKQAYPRFEKIQARFFHFYDKWIKFLADMKQTPSLTQWEVAYINSIDLDGEDADPGKILSFLGNQLDKAMTGPVEAGQIETQRVLVKNDAPWARFYISAKTGIRIDQKPHLVLELTVRGPATATRGEFDLAECQLDARQIIVAAFNELTTPEMHKRWEKIK